MSQVELQCCFLWVTDGDSALQYQGQLGEGGSGCVHKIRNSNTCELFARKVFRLESSQTQNEIDTVVNLCMKKTHQNVIAVLRHGRLQTSHFYVDLELCLFNLYQYYANIMWRFNQLTDFNPPLVEAAPRIQNAWNIMKQIAEGVRFIHSQGYVHRDLKPVNVLFGSDNIWKVADFGLTKAIKRSRTRTEAGRGTDGYRAPEIVVQLLVQPTAEYTNAVDIFAMGCILYEICFRDKAFTDDLAVNQYVTSKKPPSFPDVFKERMPSFPDKGLIQSVILRMWDLNPEKRPTAEELCRLFTFPQRHRQKDPIPSPLPPAPESISYSKLTMPPTPSTSKPSIMSIFRKQTISRDPFDALLVGDQPQIGPWILFDVIPLGWTKYEGWKTYEDTCISKSGSMLALVQRTRFEIFEVKYNNKWGFDRRCSDVLFGTSAPPASSQWRILAALSDRVICIALPGNCIEVYTVDGKLLKTIALHEQCRIIVMSYCGRFVAVGTTHGVYLYNMGQNGLCYESDVTESTIWKPANSWNKRGVANCVAFSPDSSHFSLCTSENIVRTYRLLNGATQPILLYTFDRKFDPNNITNPYYGITDLAFSSDSSKLLVVADARGNSFPVIIQKSEATYSVVPIMSKKYAHKNKSEHRICYTAISPTFFGALMTFRDGKVKFANWSGGRDHETVLEVADGELLEEETDQIRRTCSMEFSKDGMRALVVDRRGKVLAMRFQSYTL